MSKYAVIKINDKQFFVEEGDLVKSSLLSEKPEFQVLLVKDGTNLEVGEPEVSKGGVVLNLIGNVNNKVSVRRYRSKSKYRKNKSHTDKVSLLKVESIGLSVKSKITAAKSDKPSSSKKVVKKLKNK